MPAPTILSAIMKTDLTRGGCLPLHEYRCLKCGAHFEKIQKFSDLPLGVCEKCGGRLERLLSSPAIQFKGSGWYVTDYARKSAAEPSQKTEPQKTDGSSASKGETSSASDTKQAPEPSKTTKTTDS